MDRGSDKELEGGERLSVMEPWSENSIESGPTSEYLMRGASPRKRNMSPEGSNIVGDEVGAPPRYAGPMSGKGNPPPTPPGYRVVVTRAPLPWIPPDWRFEADPSYVAPRPRRRPKRRRRPVRPVRPLPSGAKPPLPPAPPPPAAGPDDGEEDFDEGGDEDELHADESAGILGDTSPLATPESSTPTSPFGTSPALASFVTATMRPRTESRTTPESRFTPSSTGKGTRVSGEPHPRPTLASAHREGARVLAKIAGEPHARPTLASANREGVRALAKIAGEEVGVALGSIHVNNDTHSDLFIFIDGRERGTAEWGGPALHVTVPPGRHIVAAYRDRGRLAEPYAFLGRSTVEVNSGQMVTLTFRGSSAESGYWTDLTSRGEHLATPEWTEIGTLGEAISRCQAAARDFRALPTLGTGVTTADSRDFRSLVYAGMTSGRYNRQRAWDLVRVYGEKWGRAMSALVFIDEIDDDERLIDEAAREVRDRVNDCRNLIRAATGA